MKSRLCAALLAATLIGLGGRSASASFLFEYWVNPTITSGIPAGTIATVPSTGPGAGGTSIYTFDGGDDGTVILGITGRSSTAPRDALLGPNTPLAEFNVVVPDDFPLTAFSFGFDLDFNLRDVTSGEVDTARISGMLAGGLSGDGSALRFMAYETAPGSLIPLTAGGRTYFLTFADPVFGPGINNPVTIQGSVIPEPGSIALVGIGGLGVVFGLRQRRRLQGAAA